MDIQFTEEQELLRSSVQRMLRDQYDFDARRKIVLPADITDDPDLYDPVTKRIREIAADLSPAEDELITGFLLRVAAALQEEDEDTL